MAERACHVFGYATQVGLTQALDAMEDYDRGSTKAITWAFLSFVIAVAAFGIVINIPRDRTITAADVCASAQAGARDKSLTDFLQKNAHTSELATNYGQCSAFKVRPNFWYAKGIIMTKAMELHRVQPRTFEAFVYEDDDLRNRYVEAYGPQLGLCSYSVNGVVSIAKLADRKLCGEAIHFEEFRRQAGI